MSQMREVLRQFWSWWCRELTGAIPRSVKKCLCPRGNTIHLDIEEDRVQVFSSADGEVEKCTEIDFEKGASAKDALPEFSKPENTTIELLVASGQALVKEIAMPRVAQKNLRKTLGYEMHRLTPFSVDDVYYDHEIVSSDDRTLQIRLSVVPKHIVHAATRWLDNWNLQHVPNTTRPSAEQAGNSPKKATKLCFRDRRYSAWSANRQLLISLAISAAALILAIFIPLISWNNDLADLQTQLVTSERDSAEYLARSRVLEQSLRQAKFLEGQINRRVSSLELLEELAMRLPDNTWLAQFEWREGTVRLQGYSSDATALIGMLEASDAFANPQFASPVVRDHKGHDQFHLVVTGKK